MHLVFKRLFFGVKKYIKDITKQSKTTQRKKNETKQNNTEEKRTKQYRTEESVVYENNITTDS